MKEVWILAEHRNNKIQETTFELISLAQQLGETTRILLLAQQAKPLLEQLQGKGAHAISYAEHEYLQHYTPDAYAHILTQLLQQHQPLALLLPHTSLGWDLAPKLAVQTKLPLATNVLHASLENNQTLQIQRPIYGQKIISHETFLQPPPWILTIPPGTFPSPETSHQEEIQALSLTPPKPRTKVLKISTSTSEGPQLEEAERIVSGGRGLKSKEKFKELLEPLAKELNAAIGASRPVVDDGWMPRECQVGSSGKTVKPKLYLAIGISGQTQHIAGMKNASCIIAINKDPDAPIFDYAHYGVVGDLFEIVPKLTEKIREAKA